MKLLLVGALAALMAAGAAAAAPDLSAMTAGELTVFLRAFPKGGELHNHLGGGTPEEALIAWAVEDGLCIDPEALAIRLTCSGDTLKPAATFVADEARRSALIDSLTVRHPRFRGRSGHDQFFTAFSRRGQSPRRTGDALAETLDVLARRKTVSLPAESDAVAVAAEMAANGILVEVNPISNRAILEIEPQDHPFSWFRQKGVPVSTSTTPSSETRTGCSIPGTFTCSVNA